MNAMWDTRCKKCDTRIGWGGEFSDHPPCRKCGWRPDAASLEREQAKIEETMALYDKAPSALTAPDLTRLRELSGLTHRQAARLLGVHPSVVSNVEVHGTRPPADVLERMAALYQTGKLP